MMNKIFEVLSGENGQAILLTGVVVVSIVFLVVTRIQIKNRAETNDKQVLKALSPSVFFWLVLCLLYIAFVVYFHENIKNPLIKKALNTLVALGIGFSFYRMSFLIAYFMRRAIAKKAWINLDETVILWSVGGIRIIILIITILAIFKIYNININALIAGLGIGGIAVALAAQDTLSNILGCIIIILDKPFVIGHRIKMLEHDGYIESVGIRSTQLRTLEGNVVIVPNKNIVGASIENVNGRQSIRQTEEIVIEATTTPEQVRMVISSIRSILENMENVRNDYQIFFDRVDAINIVLKMWYWVDTVDYWLFMQTKEHVNYSIYELLKINGIKYAVPTSAIYLKNNVDANKNLNEPLEN